MEYLWQQVGANDELVADIVVADGFSDVAVHIAVVMVTECTSDAIKDQYRCEKVDEINRGRTLYCK